MFYRQTSVLLLLAIVVYTESSCETDSRAHCSSNNFTQNRKRSKLFRWPKWCEVFHGTLNLRTIDLHRSDFSKLVKIDGGLILINSRLDRMPSMPNLVEIESDGVKPGVVILNNEHLRDVRGFVDWNKDVKVTGNSKLPVFMSGNRLLETINLPSIYHNPFSPLLCEKRLTPNYNAFLAESFSLTAVIVCFGAIASIFIVHNSFGDANVYFVPGYHKDLRHISFTSNSYPFFIVLIDAYLTGISLFH